jgi:hypothetical protein
LPQGDRIWGVASREPDRVDDLVEEVLRVMEVGLEVEAHEPVGVDLAGPLDDSAFCIEGRHVLQDGPLVFGRLLRCVHVGV